MRLEVASDCGNIFERRYVRISARCSRFTGADGRREHPRERDDLARLQWITMIRHAAGIAGRGLHDIEPILRDLGNGSALGFNLRNILRRTLVLLRMRGSLVA